MSGYWPNLLLVTCLILINALFAGSEMALVSLREGQLRQLERRGDDRALRLVRLARDPNRFLATIQIGITLAGFLASATAAVKLAEPLVPRLGVLGAWAEVVAISGVTLVLTFLTLVFGELAPKRIAMQRAMPWALAVVRPLEVIATIARPAVALLSATTSLVVRLAGGRGDQGEVSMSPEELREIVTQHPGLDPEQRRMISGALRIGDRALREVILPRGSVFVLDANLPVSEARTALAEAGHSRAPVTRHHHLDDVVGVVHWSALSPTSTGPIGAIASDALMLPETLRLPDAIRAFRAERQQLAIVVDEHGSATGIVTLEDLLEEIVGNIYDELDTRRAEISRGMDGAFVVPGAFPLHDLADLGVEVTPASSADYTTVAGLLLDRLGYVPVSAGASAEVDGWTLQVVEVTGRAITQVRLSPSPEPIT